MDTHRFPLEIKALRLKEGGDWIIESVTNKDLRMKSLSGERQDLTKCKANHYHKHF